MGCVKALFVDHVAFSDSLCRAGVGTLSAGCTNAVINDSMVVFNMDSIVLAGLFTLFTADTAVFADASCDFSYIGRAAAYIDFLVNITQNDKMVGTCLCTDTAADTLGLIDPCKTVLNDDSVLRTDLCTVAEAETSVSADL